MVEDKLTEWKSEEKAVAGESAGASVKTGAGVTGKDSSGVAAEMTAAKSAKTAFSDVKGVAETRISESTGVSAGRIDATSAGSAGFPFFFLYGRTEWTMILLILLLMMLLLQLLLIMPLLLRQMMGNAKSGPSPPLPPSLSPPKKQAHDEGAANANADAEAEVDEIVKMVQHDWQR